MNGEKGYREITQGKLNEAKAGTEGAKTRDISSAADNKDLSYLEQESGVNQARELEKLDVKAQNDLTTKIISDTVKPDTVGE